MDTDAQRHQHIRPDVKYERADAQYRVKYERANAQYRVKYGRANAQYRVKYERAYKSPKQPTRLKFVQYNKALNLWLAIYLPLPSQLIQQD